MAISVDTLVSRTMRDWLLPPDEQPSRVVLNTAITAANTVLNFKTTLLAPEETDLLATPGTVVELDYEQVLIRSSNIDLDPVQSVVFRGVNATVAAAHGEDTIGLLAPSVSRQSTYEAVADSIAELSPELYDMKTVQIVTTSTFVEMPADTIGVVDVLIQDGTRWYNHDYHLQPGFPDSFTDVALFVEAESGLNGYVRYRRNISRPTDPNESLDDLGIRDTWYRLIQVAAVAQLVARSDLPTRVVEYVTEALQREGFPTGSAARVRDSLLRYHSYLLDKAKRELTYQHTSKVHTSHIL